MRNLKALIASSMLLLLTACTLGTTSLDGANTGRDVKLLLDERRIQCESFDVEVNEETGAEVLTCLDGTSSQGEFQFLVWDSTESRDAGLEGFCYNLNRRGNAAFELIVQRTWIAYSDSSFFPASALAEELDAKIVSGEEFCTNQGLEVALVLSDDGIQKCQSIIDLAARFGGVGVTRYAIPYGFNELVSKNRGPYLTPNVSTIQAMTNTLRTDMRALSRIEDVPEDLKAAVRDFPYSDLVDKAQTGDNGSSLDYFFPDFDEDLEGQAQLDDLNFQVSLFNISLKGFETQVQVFNLQLMSVTSLCQKYAPFD